MGRSNYTMIAPQSNPWDKWSSQNITPESSTKDFVKENSIENKKEENFSPPTISESAKQLWDKWRVDTPVSEWPKTVARYASRTAEQVAGLPGDIVQGIRGLISEYPKATGLLGYVAEKVSPGIMKEAVEGVGKGYEIGSPTQLPTSQELKELSGKATKGFTLPEKKSEEKMEEGYQDFLSLLIQPPSTRAFKSNRIVSPLLQNAEPWVRALGTSVIANGAAESVRAIGGKDTDALKAKMGAMFLSGLLIPGRTARQLGRDLYAERDASLRGVNTMHDARRFTHELNQERTLLMRGTPGAHEREVINRIDDLLQRSQSGMIDVHDLVAAKRQINEAREGLFSLPRQARRTARQRYNHLARVVDDELEAYGRTQNPQFLHFQRAADEVYRVTQASNVVGNMVQRVAPVMGLKSPVAAAFSHGVAATIGSSIGAVAKGGIGSAIPISVGAGAGSTVYQTGKIMYRIARSPNLRHLYGQVVANSLEGNTVAMMKNLKKLDEAYIASEKRNPNLISPEQRRAHAVQKRQELSKPRKESEKKHK